MQALLGSLTDAERMLVRETQREQLIELSEDDLVALHTRVRRARDKYVNLYRRASASRVTTVGGRGKAYAKGNRDRGKAEVFEDALARVSRQLASAAKSSATALKAERLAEARAARNERPPKASPPRRSPVQEAQRIDRRPQSPNRVKRHATTRAAGARRQARKDARATK
jgi:hypothetical protein